MRVVMAFSDAMHYVHMYHCTQLFKQSCGPAADDKKASQEKSHHSTCSRLATERWVFEGTKSGTNEVGKTCHGTKGEAVKFRESATKRMKHRQNFRG